MSDHAMSLDEALEFFAAFGNVARDPAELKGTKPTLGQLAAAAGMALACGQDRAMVAAARDAILAAGAYRVADLPDDPDDDGSMGSCDDCGTNLCGGEQDDGLCDQCSWARSQGGG